MSECHTAPVPVLCEAPDFDDPYHGEGEIDNFCYRDDLVILRMAAAIDMGGDREADYIVANPYRVDFTVDGKERSITVPRGMLTDLTSVPPVFRSLVNRVGPHLEAAIVHDFLYIAWADLGRGARKEDWRYANQVMIAGMRQAGVGYFTCILIAIAIYSPIGWWRYCSKDDQEAPHYVDLEPMMPLTEAPAPAEAPPMPTSAGSEDAGTAHPPSV